jgi:hypothetical protein
MMPELVEDTGLFIDFFISYFVYSSLGILTSGTRRGEETSVNSEDNLLTTIGRLLRRNASSCYHTFYQSGGISGHSGDLLRLAT